MSSRYTLLAICSALVLGALILFKNPCLYTKDCASSRGIYLISESVEKRTFAKEAVRAAEKNFRVLFSHRPVTGTILLDKGILEPPIIRLQSHWRMRFDPIGSVLLSDVIDVKEFFSGANFLLSEEVVLDNGKIGSSGEPISVSFGERNFDTAMHEICHALFSNSMAGRSYSDAMDEIAAVSCESDDYLGLRMQDFKKSAGEFDPVPWNEFLEMRHPLKDHNEFAKALRAGASRAETSLGFVLDNESELGRSVDLFYAQAAVFSLYWKARCPNENILSDLARSLSEKTKFSEWLAASNSKCVPGSIADFEASLNAMLLLA